CRIPLISTPFPTRRSSDLGGHPLVLAALIGGDGGAVGGLDLLGFLSAQPAQEVHDCLVVLVVGGGSVAQTVGDGGTSVASGGVGSLGQHGHVPLALHLRVVLHLAEQAP